MADTYESLGEAKARVERVDDHLKELKEAIAAYADECMDALRIVKDNEGNVVEVFEPFDFPNPSPASLIVMGEVIYNLRAALDHLVWMLAYENVGTEVDGTQFPIEDDPDMFEARITGWCGTRKVARFLKSVHPDHVELIRLLQPFEGCEWTSVLRDLSNPDKHRHLSVLLARADLDPYFHLTPLSGPEGEPPWIDMSVGAVVDIHIGFRDAEGHDVMETLGVLKECVGRAVDLFDDALTEMFEARRSKASEAIGPSDHGDPSPSKG